MAERVVVGLDTSCYTTSVAAVTLDGMVTFDRRRVLAVPEGAIGLRQSEAVFVHIKQLPPLLEKASLELRGLEVAAVCVSARPKPDPGSYLPVFLAGAVAAQALATGAGCPLLKTNHQAGHLAVIPDFWAADPVIAVHLSGGTTEVLLVSGDRADPDSYTVLTKSTDLHAGQLIDRIGQRLGLAFPAGARLDDLARYDPEVSLPSHYREGSISFSGPHSAALRLLDAGCPPAAVAHAVLRCIGRSIAKALEDARAKTGIDCVVIGGGVSASEVIRVELARRLGGRLTLVFADRLLCTDNAVGVARCGVRLMPGR